MHMLVAQESTLAPTKTSAGTQDHNPVASLGSRLPQRTVHCDAGAEHRRSCIAGQGFWNGSDITCWSKNVLLGGSVSKLRYALPRAEIT